MYEQHFGLTKNPFGMTPEPGLLYLTPAHREALAGLAYAILERKGFVMLTGEAGTGKSTLLARTLQQLPASRVVSSVILNPTLTESEFLELAMLDFGFPTVPASKAQRLVQLQEFLLRTRQSGKIAVLVIDEAHKLSTQVLEEVRLLSNLELPGEKLLQIVLAAQEELLETLNRPELRQFSQRIAVRLSLSTLETADIEQYIALRWSKAGGQTPPPFTADAYAEIGRWSRGIPRLVNAVCENALVNAMAEKPSVVGVPQVREAARDLALLREAPAAPPVSVPPAAWAPETPKAVVPAADTPVRVPAASLRMLGPYQEVKQARLSRWMTKLGLVRQEAQ